MKVVSLLNPDTLRAVREILVDVLSVDLEEMTSQESNFYYDLGGESIDLLDLNFHIEKRWGIKLAAKSFTDRIATFSTEESIESINETLRSEFQFSQGIQLDQADLGDIKRLMTIEFIAHMIDFERCERKQ